MKIEGVLPAAAIALTLASPALAQEVDFAGETIELIVPYGEGGGQSVHARILAPLLEQDLTGNPTIVIRNIPGGGALVGLNQFAQRADPDGLMIGSLSASAFYQHILNDPRVEFDLTGFKPFLASPYGLAREVYDAMFAVRMAAAKTIVLSPDTPEDIVKTYQETMARVVQRPELQDEVAQIQLGGYPQGTGEVALRGHRQASVMSPEAKAELVRWLSEVWDAGLP